MSEINILSDGDLVRVQRSILTTENQPVPVNSYRKKSRRGNNGASTTPIQSFPFQTTQKWNVIDEVYNVRVNAGQVVLPDSQELLPVYEFDNDLDTDVYIYIKITGTRVDNGGFDDLVAVIEENLEQQVNEPSVNYFLVSYIIANSINQERNTSLDSGGNIA
jgi:hypothetical protein